MSITIRMPVLQIISVIGAPKPINELLVELFHCMMEARQMMAGPNVSDRVFGACALRSCIMSIPSAPASTPPVQTVHFSYGLTYSSKHASPACLFGVFAKETTQKRRTQQKCLSDERKGAEFFAQAPHDKVAQIPNVSRVASRKYNRS